MKEIKLIERATDQENGTYAVHGVDESQTVYNIIWDIINTEAEVEEDCCDWDNPTSITIIDHDTLWNDVDIPEFSSITTGSVYIAIDTRKYEGFKSSTYYPGWISAKKIDAEYQNLEDMMVQIDVEFSSIVKKIMDNSILGIPMRNIGECLSPREIPSTITVTNGSDVTIRIDTAKYFKKYGNFLRVIAG